jgi:hypothetical protein
MTDRLKGCTVVFGKDIREDDAEYILNAIRMIKGVSQVEPVISESGDLITEMRMERRVIEFLQDLPHLFVEKQKNTPK